MATVALSKEWQGELDRAKASSFVLLPIELQAKGYTYDYVAKAYLEFFEADNSRQEALVLARKFSKFISNLNRNRIKHELGPDFFKAFQFYMENFDTLLKKPDRIKLETIDLISEGLDRSRFVEDIISFDELKMRTKRIEKMEEQDAAIDAEWEQLETEYSQRNAHREVQNV